MLRLRIPFRLIHGVAFSSFVIDNFTSVLRGGRIRVYVRRILVIDVILDRGSFRLQYFNDD